MKTNNKMNELRKSQRQELTSIVSRLSEIDEIKTAYYKANPYKGGFKGHELQQLLRLCGYADIADNFVL